ncbi:MAG: cytochrome c oxidase subunit II [Gaiella sp.]
MVPRGALIRMIAIGLVATIVAVIVAWQIQWLPTSASEEMDRLAFVYWFATIICIGIFAVVAAALVYSVWAFRVAPGDETDGPPIHGNSTLEVVWTAIPAILVIAIGVVSAVVLSRNADAGDNPLTVKVYAQQFAWYFEYPDAGDARSEELVLPVGRGVNFEMTSFDVIHSFWVPEMGQKMDLVPGIVTEIVVTPTRTGSFSLVCTELCGLGHATMRAPVRVVKQAEFAAWLDELGAPDEGGGGAAAAGEAVFASAGCGGCHAFGPAGTDAEVGPALDDLTAAAEAAGQELPDFVRESIVDPNKVVTEGYQPGVMPGAYGDSLSAEEIDALVAYLTGEETTQ